MPGKAGTWMKAPTRIASDAALWANPSAARVLLVLYTCRNTKTGAAWPTQDQIAETIGASRWTVSRAIKRLKVLGFVEAERHGGPGNRITYTFPNDPCIRVDSDVAPSAQQPGCSAKRATSEPARMGRQGATTEPVSDVANTPHSDGARTASPTNARACRNKMRTRREEEHTHPAVRVDLAAPAASATDAGNVCALIQTMGERCQTEPDGEPDPSRDPDATAKRDALAAAGVRGWNLNQIALGGEFGLDRIQAVCRQAADEDKGPGWIVRAITEGWQTTATQPRNRTPEEQEAVEAQAVEVRRAAIQRLEDAYRAKGDTLQGHIPARSETT